MRGFRSTSTRATRPPSAREASHSTAGLFCVGSKQNTVYTSYYGEVTAMRRLLDWWTRLPTATLLLMGTTLGFTFLYGAYKLTDHQQIDTAQIDMADD